LTSYTEKNLDCLIQNNLTHTIEKIGLIGLISRLPHSKKFDSYDPENWTGSIQFLDCDSLTNINNTKIDSQNYWLDYHSLEIGLSQSNFLDRVSNFFKRGSLEIRLWQSKIFIGVRVPFIQIPTKKC
jgi:hypothetical protein